MATNHPKTNPETLRAVYAAYRLAAAGQPFCEELCKGLPQGSIYEVRAVSEHEVTLTVRTRNGVGRSPRKLPALGCLVVRVLALCGGSPYFNPDRRKGHKGELHYLYISGFPVARILANAGQGFKVDFKGDHRDLCPSNLQLVSTKRGLTTAARPNATAEALSNFDSNAAKWGLAALLSRDEYAAMIEHCYRLFDKRYAHLLRGPEIEAAE